MPTAPEFFKLYKIRKDKMTLPERAAFLYRYVAEYGHRWMVDEELVEYSAARLAEYQARKAELVAQGATNIRAKKDPAGDIVGWEFALPLPK